jgi:hypothetical protein
MLLLSTAAYALCYILIQLEANREYVSGIDYCIAIATLKTDSDGAWPSQRCA